VLLDAEDKQEQSYAVQNWVRRLKDVLIPVDDLLDEFLIQDMIQKRGEPHRKKVKKGTSILLFKQICFAS
jgi:leucine-rich repeat protein SHOC2